MIVIPFVVNISGVLTEEGCEGEEFGKRCGKNDIKNFLTRNAVELVGMVQAWVAPKLANVTF